MNTISIFKFIFLILNILNAQVYTLEDCIQISIDEKDSSICRYWCGFRSKGLKASYSGVLPSIQATGTSGVNYFPSQESININFEELKFDTTRTNHFNTLSAGVAINQVIYDGGRSLNQIKQAKTNLDIAKYNQRSIKTQVIEKVIRSYMAYFRLKNY